MKAHFKEMRPHSQHPAWYGNIHALKGFTKTVATPRRGSLQCGKGGKTENKKKEVLLLNTHVVSSVKERLLSAHQTWGALIYTHV